MTGADIKTDGITHEGDKQHHSKLCGDDGKTGSTEKRNQSKERKPVLLACIACRRKKTRCSGENPACKKCSQSRIPCVYKTRPKRAASSTAYKELVDRHLKGMETRVLAMIEKGQDGSSFAFSRSIV